MRNKKKNNQKHLPEKNKMRMKMKKTVTNKQQQQYRGLNTRDRIFVEAFL